MIAGPTTPDPSAHPGWQRAPLVHAASPALVIDRLRRAAHAVDVLPDRPSGAARLGPGDADTLVTLLRAGPPYALNPGRLSAETGVTTGAATKRVDRLDRRGLVTRRVSPHDARSRVVTLTAEGRALAELLVERQEEQRRRLLRRLSNEELDTLGALLGRLLTPAPQPDGNAPGDAG